MSMERGIDQTWIETAKKILKPDEKGRPKAYWDGTAKDATPQPGEGSLTIGYGRNLSAVGLDPEEMDFLLERDIWRAISGARRVFGNDLFDSWSPARQQGVVCLVFNLGAEKLLKSFTETVPAIKQENWPAVKELLLKTKWSRDIDPDQRVGEGRDDRIVNLIVEERYDPSYGILG